MSCIAIFEDDESIRDLCRFILEEQGYEIKEFDNSHDVMEKIKMVNPDLIMMDNQIDGVGGLTATKMIKADEKYKSVPLIYFSASHDIANLANKAGADFYLEKPFDIGELEKLIGEILQTAKNPAP